MNSDGQDSESTSRESPPDLEDQSEDDTNWFVLILNIPKLGGFLSFCIAVAPLFVLIILFLILGDIFGFDANVDDYMDYVILAAIIPTYFWLVFLENKARVQLCLPIPFVNIPIKWILFPIFIIFVLSVFGIL